MTTPLLLPLLWTWRRAVGNKLKTPKKKPNKKKEKEEEAKYTLPSKENEVKELTVEIAQSAQHGGQITL